MKTQLTLLTLAAFASAAFAADPPAKPSAPSKDATSFKTADEHWAHVEEQQKPPTEQPQSRDEAVSTFKAWLAGQDAAAESFLKAHPKDPRSWQAKVIRLRAALQTRRIDGGGPTPEEKQQIDEIIKAPEASAETKGEAAFIRVMMLTGDFKQAEPQTFAAFHKAAGEYLKEHGSHPLAKQVRAMQLQILSSIDLPENKALLEEIAQSGDAEAAEQAKQVIARKAQMAELETKPVPLKFTAVDGKKIDLEKMRGKVVLLDFWASWCGPCITEMPNVVATYAQYKPKGFEVIGISLDQDKEAMEASMKKLKMTWPQHFDGKGWGNEISSAFGINSIPATWLIDKKGMLRETQVRGEALGEAVKKLLAE